jgi:hypothetical protein
MKRFLLRATVSTESPEVVRAILERELPRASISPSGRSTEYRVEGALDGESARDLNRALLSALRRGEKRTRLRAEWTCEGTTERFFDYVPKGSRPSAREPPR